MSQVHKLWRPFRCDVCKKGIKDKFSLSKHQIEGHEVQTGGSDCDLCKASDGNEFTCCAHGKAKDRPYGCKMCQR